MSQTLKARNEGTAKDFEALQMATQIQSTVEIINAIEKMEENVIRAIKRLN